MMPRFGNAPPSLWSISLAAVLIGHYAAASVQATAPGHPVSPPSKFPSGVPIRATKLPIKVGMPDPYAMLAKAVAKIKSDFEPKSSASEPDWLGAASSLMALAYLQLQGGDHAGAAEALHDAEIAVRSMSDSWKCSMMAGVASMLAESGDTDAGRHLMRDAIAIARGLTSGATEEENTLEKIRTLMELGRSAAAADKTTAREVVDEVAEMVKRLGNDVDDKPTLLGELVELRLQLKDFPEARVTAQLIGRKEGDETLDSLFETIAKAQAEAGNPAGALDTLRLIDANASCRDEALLAVVKRYAATGNVKQAISLLPRFGEAVQNLQRDEALFRIAGAQIAAGDFAAAIATTNRIDVYGGYPFESLIAIAKARFARHDGAGAQATLRNAADLAVETAREYGPAAIWLYDDVEKLVAAQLAMQDKPGAHKTLRDVAAGALEHRDPQPNDAAVTLTRIAKAQIAAGDTQGARQTVQLALERAATFEELHPSDQKSAALTAIARLQAQLHDDVGMRKTFRAATEAARRLNKDGELIRIFGMIAVARVQAELGEKASAFALADEAANLAREKLPQAPGRNIVAALAEVRAAAGDNEGAESLLLGLPLGDFLFPYQHGDDHREDVIVMLIRHGRYGVVSGIAERSGSAYPKLRSLDVRVTT